MVSSKSWSYLFTTYGYGDNESGSRGIRSYPTSYTYAGIYYWDAGKLYHQTLYGYYWPSSIASNSGSYYLFIDNTRLIKADRYNKRFGYILRCI